MKRAILRAMLVLLVVLVSAAALADVRNEPVEISLKNPVRPARTGEIYRDIIRIEGNGDHVITGLNLSGMGWTVSLDGEGSRRLVSAGEVLEIPFTATPGNPDIPLVLSWYADDRYNEMVIDRSAGACERAKPRMSLMLGRGEVAIPREINVPSSEFLTHLEGLTAKEILARCAEPTPSSTDKSLNILVTGTIEYNFGLIGQFISPRGLEVSVVASKWTPAETHEVVANGTTDVNGDFHINLSWPYAEDPDIQVFYYAANGATRVYNWDGLEQPWMFSTSIFLSQTSTSLDVGLLRPGGVSGNMALHAAETVRRAWEFYFSELGYDFPRLDTRLNTLDDGTSHYSSGQQYIYIYSGAAWSTDVYGHEYGHYVHNQLPMEYPSGGGYCDPNTYCDDDPDSGDCGHCLECDENAATAFIEGWAQFCAQLTIDYIKDTFALPADPGDGRIQSIGPCYNSEETFPQTPSINEGIFAAALYDLVDEDYGEEDENNPQGFRDNVGGYLEDVFTCLNTSCTGLGRVPQSPVETLQCFLDQHPEDKVAIEESYRNNRYFFDTTPPGAPTNLASYPAAGTPTPDNTIHVTWTPPVDDLSGVDAYNVIWVMNSPLMPGSGVPNLGTTSSLVSDNLAVGEWYFCIRARDAAGNWSETFAWDGPFIIIPAEGPDLADHQPAGWDYPFVPMDDINGGPALAQVSTRLNGGVNDTYWNIAYQNLGDVMSTPTMAHIVMDGDTVVDSVAIPPIGALAPGGEYNMGPANIPAGRHVLGMFLDSDELMAEDSELDNYWYGQWSWRTSTPLAGGAWTMEPAPPDPLGGFGLFNDTQTYYSNCDGFYIDAWPRCQGVYILPEEIQADYDVALYHHDSLANLGFTGGHMKAYSGRGPGKLDVVISNGFNAGFLNTYDVGVMNESFDPEYADGEYRISRVMDVNMAEGHEYEGSLYNGRMIDLYTFTPDAGGTGFCTIRLDPHFPDPVNLSFFDGNFTVGSLTQATETATISGREELLLNIQATPGSFCTVAVWMDPVGNMSQYHYYDLTYSATPSDPRINQPNNWAGCLVPRDADDRSWPYSPPVPDRLVGNEDSTFVYYAEINSSTAACPAHEVDLHLDGEVLDTLTPPNALNPNVGTVQAGPGFYNIPGGRHTLTMALDPGDVVTELIEYNNAGGAQWAWSGETLYETVMMRRDMPTDAFGGMDELDTDWVFYNCLGFRTENLWEHGARFGVIYAAGGADTADVDLRMFEPTDDTQLGFSLPVSSSLMGPGQEEFVIVSMTHVPYEALDVGVVGNMPGGSKCFTQLNTSDSASHLNGAGLYQNIDLGGLVNVHHFDLPPGWYEISMTNDNDRVDLGISAQVVFIYSQRSDVVSHAQSWTAPPGEQENILVNVLEGLNYALVVWSVRPHLSYQELTEYDLDIKALSDVEGDLLPAPKVPRLVGASPNPFNPRTSIKFETTNRSPVSLRVFDLSGRLVKILVSETLNPGRHEAVWEGSNSQGRKVSSGVYFYRLETNGFSATKRMTLVK